MNIEDIITLIKAGYTKEDIEKITSSDKATENPVKGSMPDKTLDSDTVKGSSAPDVQAAENETKMPPESSDVPDPLEDIKKQMSAMSDTIIKMSKVLINPALDDVKPLGIDDIVTKFFKED